MSEWGPFCACALRLYRYNGARPHMKDGEPGWVRCWTCGGLWDRNGNDVLATWPDLALTAEELSRGRKEIA